MKYAPSMPPNPRRDAPLALLLAVLGVAALAVLYLNPYVLRDIAFPLGFDATFYITRANQVSVVGLEQIGLVRSGTPLLLAVLMAVTGLDAFTLVAWVPALLTGVAGLAAAAMLRAAFDVSRWWIPVATVLTWTAFGKNTMVSVHLDNLLNTALILGGLAAAVASIRWGRGAAAAFLLFVTGGLAHWPFYALAMAAFVPAVLLFARREAVAWLRGGRFPAVAGRLLLPAVGSGAVVAASFVPTRPGTQGINLVADLLRRRFLVRLAEPFRYLAVPFAVGGVVAGVRLPPSPLPPARRFLLWLMGTWTAVTVVGGLLQLAGLPTAGARLLNYLFPLAILAAAGLWGLVVWLRGREPGPARSAGLAAAGAVVAAAVVGSFVLSWILRGDVAAWLGREAVTQVARADRYVTRVTPEATLVFVVGESRANRWWSITRSTLSPEAVLRAERAIAFPDDYAALARGELDALSGIEPDAVVLALQMFNRPLFARLAESGSDRVVAPGVAVLRGPLPAGPLGPPDVPRVSTAAQDVAAGSALVLLVLFVAGSGWAVALTRPDTVVRVCLSPGLGVATIIVAALGWDLLSLPFDAPGGAGPAAVAAAGGWIAAAVRPRGNAGTDPETLDGGPGL